jgi:hypothetical protein
MTILLATFCYSIDRSVYVGTWKSGGNENITIVINGNFDIVVYARNKKLPNIEFIIDYAKNGNITSAIPFLYIESHDGNDIEETFSLIIGFKGIWNAKNDNTYNVLRGFYEVSKIISNDGELDERSIPIEFKRNMLNR